MGTNYYWRHNICVVCDRRDEVHVWKNSGTFRAYLHELLDENHPEWGYNITSPFGEPVLSRADWVRVLTNRPGELYDEYGERIPDPVDWLRALAPPAAEDIAHDETARQRGRWYDANDTREWRDPEGFRFYAGEFS